MAAEAPPTSTPQHAAGPSGPNHGLRIFLIWLPVAIAADLVLWLVYKPHMPPGDMSTTAANQQFDIAVLSVIAAPVMAFVLIYFAYALVTWRARPDDEEDGPALHGNTRIQATWITVSSVIVLALFVFGTVELYASNGSGGGQGASPIQVPGGPKLQVQVIAQQWKFTYRYPQYGGFETSDLVLPTGTWVQFNVTSIDVIHSFWAYQLGVKADANPGVNNIAFTKISNAGTFVVRCSELCGLWHGAMFDYGQAMSPSGFSAWARATEVRLASVTAQIPPYALTYDPTVVAQMSKAMVAAGLTGAPGLYYPPQDVLQP
jgi:cytochrome c oxidase subunit II